MSGFCEIQKSFLGMSHSLRNGREPRTRATERHARVKRATSYSLESLSTNGNFPFFQRTIKTTTTTTTTKTILVDLSGRRYFHPRVSPSLALHAFFRALYIFHAPSTQATMQVKSVGTLSEILLK